jgi:hypothetical protein
MNRITEQLNEFNPQALKYFFSPKTVASCKSVVLFINKSDLVGGPPAQAEAYAKQLFQPLIDSLMKYSTQIDVKVLVGSASYGHSTHLLFSYFVEQILPKSAYDQQLLQRIKAAEFRPRDRLPTLTPSSPNSQSQPQFPAPQIPHQQHPPNGTPHPQAHYAQVQPQQPQQAMQPQYGTPGPRPMMNRGTGQMPAAPQAPLDGTAPFLQRPPIPPSPPRKA